MLQADPSLAAQFNEVYGENAAAQYLEGKPGPPAGPPLDDIWGLLGHATEAYKRGEYTEALRDYEHSMVQGELQKLFDANQRGTVHLNIANTLWRLHRCVLCASVAQARHNQEAAACSAAGGAVAGM